MKRFHVHLVVRDLDAGIAFYRRLFGRPPSRHEADYAKWMLEDPRVNFAISTHGEAAGLAHLGLQVDSPAELAELRDLAERAAPGAVRDEGSTSCCYAQSDKHWVADPQGTPWEHFHTTAELSGACCETGAGASACCATLESASCCATSDAGAGCSP